MRLELQIDGGTVEEHLMWQPRTARDEQMVDAKRATEDGAECIALSIVSQRRRWRLVRRLQSTLAEGADWVLEEDQTKRRIVLEISGTDDGPFERRVREKSHQARLASLRGAPAVSVVRFMEPKALLAEVKP